MRKPWNFISKIIKNKYEKTVLIGATGTIGKAVYHKLSDKGYDVIPPSRKSNPFIDIENKESIDNFC
ncbi:MAG: NAD-dependent epimerase/dehydratase family protein [Candidatus Cyclobacteriaceae bacterium M3_2C_046]